MPRLKSALDTLSAEFAANAAAMGALVADLRAKVTAVKQGGGAVARDRHLARGKLLPRDRVRAAARSRLAVPRALAARRPRGL